MHFSSLALSEGIVVFALVRFNARNLHTPYIDHEPHGLFCQSALAGVAAVEP